LLAEIKSCGYASKPETQSNRGSSGKDPFVNSVGHGLVIFNSLGQQRKNMEGFSSLHKRR
jgi:hypothetical protein